MKRFGKSFTQQEPIPEAGIEAAIAVMRSGRLHRYNVEGEEIGEAAALEKEFARYLDIDYCLACASGGYALQIAMRAVGVRPGDAVLCNGFTLAPVPGALHNVGAEPIWVETTQQLSIDLDHLDAQAAASGAKYLMLSHMRGHMPDMERLMDICDRRGICVIEDCAHTMGAAWNGRKSGTFGHVGCFSTQSYKHLNSGEGGLLVSADEQVIARAILHSGSYMLFERHGAAPPAAAFEAFIYDTPNYSGRMDNLRAAVLRPQLRALDENCQRWNVLYAVLEERLRESDAILLPARPCEEQYVASSIQFMLPRLSPAGFQALLERCGGRGVDLKWFGAPRPKGYTSRFDDWRFFDSAADLPQTTSLLAGLLDMRIPLTFNEEDCELLAAIILEEVGEVHRHDGA